MAFNDKLGSAFVEVRAKMDKLKKDLGKATSSVKTSANKMSSSFKESSNKMVASMSRARLAILGIATALALVGRSVFNATASIESMQVALESALGSASAANQLLEELKEFSAKTPFQLENIAGATRQLLAAGVGAEEVISQLKILGDIASGANVPLSDMASIFAKIENKGKAMTEEILQLSDRGVPIIRVLADEFGVAREEIFLLASQGKISADVINNAFISMTSEGGIFFDQMQKQSETLSGKLSTLIDNAKLLADAFGRVLGPAIKAVFDLVTSLIQGLTSLTNTVADFFGSLAEGRDSGFSQAFDGFIANTKEAKKEVKDLQQEVEKLTPGTRPAAEKVRGRRTSSVKGPTRASIVGKEVETVEDQIQSSVQSGFSDGIKEAMRGGDLKSGLDSFFNSIFDSIADNFADQISGAIFNAGGGTQGGGILGGLFSGIGDFFGGFFADGGRPPTNKVSMVGERGPELFVPDSAGTIIPNEALGIGGGQAINVINNNNFAGVDSVNRQELLNALQQSEQRTVVAVARQSRNGGSYSKQLRGAA